MSDESRATGALAELRRLPTDAQIKDASEALRVALSSGDDVALLRATARAEAVLELKGAKAWHSNPRQLRDRMGRWTTLGGLPRSPRSPLLSSLPERELRRRLAGDGSNLPGVRERRQLLDALASKLPAKRRTPTPIPTARGAARISSITMEKLRNAFSHDERASDKQPQPVSDLGSLYERASDEDTHFRQVLDLGAGVAKRLGAIVHQKLAGVRKAVESNPDRPHVILAGLKEIGRARRKAEAKYHGNATRLTDVVRGSVVVPHVDDIPAALDAVRAELPPGWKITEPVNRFVDEGDSVNTGPLPSGYRDVSMLLTTPEGWQSELQILPAPMFVAKQGKGHDYYARMRDINADPQGPNGELSDAQAAEMQQLTEQSRALYEQAFNDSTRPRAEVVANPFMTAAQAAAPGPLVTAVGPGIPRHHQVQVRRQGYTLTSSGGAFYIIAPGYNTTRYHTLEAALTALNRLAPPNRRPARRLQRYR